MLKIIRCGKQLRFLSRGFSVSNVLREDEKKPKKKVSEPVELVHLIDQNNKFLGIKPKTESVKLARKLNLSLEKLEDHKFGKTYPAYKMVAISDLLKSDTKPVSEKSVKKLPINYRISDHDLKIKLTTVRKWLLKKHEVHVAIPGNNETFKLMKQLFEKFKEDIKEDGRIINVREKDFAIKFIILPPKESPDIYNKLKNGSKKESTDPPS